MIRKVALLCVCLFVVPVWADDVQEVNRLLVETVKLVKEARSLERATAAVGLLEEAMEHLNTIVNDYSGTDAAVKLATGEEIGNLSLDGVQFLLNMARFGAEREPEQCSGYPVLVPPVLSEEEQAMLEGYKLRVGGSDEDRERVLDELFVMEESLQRDAFFVAVGMELGRLGDAKRANEAVELGESETASCPEQELIVLIEVLKNNGHEEGAVQVLKKMFFQSARRAAIDRFWGGQEP